jgi:hypothetical protein
VVIASLSLSRPEMFTVSETSREIAVTPGVIFAEVTAKVRFAMIFVSL